MSTLTYMEWCTCISMGCVCACGVVCTCMHLGSFVCAYRVVYIYMGGCVCVYGVVYMHMGVVCVHME